MMMGDLETVDLFTFALGGIAHLIISKYFKAQFTPLISRFLAKFMSGLFRACWLFDLMEWSVLPLWLIYYSHMRIGGTGKVHPV